MSTFVGLHDLVECCRVDAVAVAWQVSCLTVAPQLTLWQLADLATELLKVVPSLIADCVPVQPQGARFGVAAIAFQVAGVWAGIP